MPTPSRRGAFPAAAPAAGGTCRLHADEAKLITSVLAALPFSTIFFPCFNLSNLADRDRTSPQTIARLEAVHVSPLNLPFHKLCSLVSHQRVFLPPDLVIHLIFPSLPSFNTLFQASPPEQDTLISRASALLPISSARLFAALSFEDPGVILCR